MPSFVSESVPRVDAVSTPHWRPVATEFPWDCSRDGLQAVWDLFVRVGFQAEIDAGEKSAVPPTPCADPRASVSRSVA
jgi:hypothetical protein